ncbi:hypothetical protein GCM10009838_48270 [Catenulispora subtropica]|uniref:Uncharacterized protein n=1 Tax=Catenulispora subtropica TaxID=450798 RepID=A0ABP5DJJ8_9ACTN
MDRLSEFGLDPGFEALFEDRAGVAPAVDAEARFDDRLQQVRGQPVGGDAGTAGGGAESQPRADAPRRRDNRASRRRGAEWGCSSEDTASLVSGGEPPAAERRCESRIRPIV